MLCVTKLYEQILIRPTDQHLVLQTYYNLRQVMLSLRCIRSCLKSNTRSLTQTEKEKVQEANSPLQNTLNALTNDEVK